MKRLAQVIACDIHHLNNLRVLEYLRARYGAGDEAVATDVAESPFLTGTLPGLFEVCLVPQLANARRYDLNLRSYPRLLEIDARATALESFARTAPSP